MELYTRIEQILLKLRPAFSREVPFEWFVLLMWGLLLSHQPAAVTSYVNGLRLDESYYGTALHWFYSRAFRIDEICQRWGRWLSSHTADPRVITVDRNAAYPPAITGLIADKALPETTETPQSKYLNNTVEQDHRFIKRRVKPGLGLGSFNMAKRTIKGYEVMNMIRKVQSKDAERGDVM